jgi:hypothetical protein
MGKPEPQDYTAAVVGAVVTAQGLVLVVPEL